MWGGLDQDIRKGGWMGGGGGHPIPHPPKPVPSFWEQGDCGCGNAGSRTEESGQRNATQRERRGEMKRGTYLEVAEWCGLFPLADGDTAFQWHFGFVRHSLMTGQSLNEF